MHLQACTEWFVRLRPSLLKLSAALAHHSATAHHGLKRLELLPRQVQAALAPAPVLGRSIAQQAVSARMTAGQSVASQKQPKPVKGQQRQAVPVKALEPPRILRRSTASDEGENTMGSERPSRSSLKPSHPETQKSQPDWESHSSGSGEKASAQPGSAKEKLLQELMDTMWMTCSALAELAQPDDIAGLQPIAGSAFLRLSSATLRQVFFLVTYCHQRLLREALNLHLSAGHMMQGGR